MPSRKRLLILAVCSCMSVASFGRTSDSEQTLEDMMDTEIVSAASLVKTKRKLTPSTMTTITQAQIQQSGARDLFELMDIFVPNFQYVSDDTQPRHMGLRGVMSNRDDKYMLLVNGRIMNEKTDFGAFSERDLPMLSDIHHIDVVRGPGSGLHGPGALAMVISIVTENADTFQGTEVTAKAGMGETFQSYEFKHGMELPNGAGLYGYVGATEYPGAAQDEASAYFGRQWSVDWDGTGSRTYGAGESVNEGLARYNEAYLGRTKWKGHLEYTQGGLDIWARHTSGGEYFTNPYSEGEAAGYKQDTVYAKYDQVFNEQFSIAYSVSMDQTSIEEPQSTMYRKQYAEREIVGRILAQWQPSLKHTIAVGSEWSYETLGMDYKGEALHTNNVIAEQWNTNMASVFGEYQWQIADKWQLFLGGRLDKHSYTDTLCSPRGTLIYMPTLRDTIKLIVARSVRTNLAYWTREEHTTIGGKSTPETLESLELRYERLYSENTLLGASLFYHDHDLIEWHWNPQIWRQTLIGNVQSYGAEVEASYRLRETRIDLSHS